MKLSEKFLSRRNKIKSYKKFLGKKNIIKYAIFFYLKDEQNQIMQEILEGMGKLEIPCFGIMHCTTEIW